jgi:hypothetical protein
MILRPACHGSYPALFPPSDINFGGLTMRVSRGVDDGVVDELKTGYYEDELPLDPRRD